MGREDGVLQSDAEQQRRERHGGQTEDRVPDAEVQRDLEEEPSAVSLVLLVNYAVILC